MRVQEHDLLPDALCESKAASSQSTSYLLPLIIPGKIHTFAPNHYVRKGLRTVAFTVVPGMFVKPILVVYAFWDHYVTTQPK